MESFSALLALCEGNSPVIGEFPSQRPVTRSFDVFFDLRPNKRLTKQLRRRWFETPSRSLRRHYNVSRKCICNLHDVCRIYSFEYTWCLLSHTVWGDLMFSVCFRCRMRHVRHCNDSAFHSKTVCAKPSIFGTKKVQMGRNVLDGHSVTLAQSHGCVID